MNILDIYSRLRYGSMALEGEFLYPNGSTESAQYSQMGGTGACATDVSRAQKDLMCSSASIDWVSALFKARYQFSSSGSEATLSSTDAVQRRGVPAANRRESHSAGMWLGFASGDADAFKNGNGGVNMGVMHPNVRPSLLMFSGLKVQEPGMPGATVANAIFARGDYTFESPTSGAVTPSLVWGMLRETRSADAGKSLADTEGVGRYSDLGFELQVSYSYITTDFLKLGADLSFWKPGAAWSQKGTSAPDYVLGGRLSVSTVFH
jgi:hypothetical protein